MKTSGSEKYYFMMLLAAFFWGTTFAAQRISAQYVDPFTWVAARALLAALLITVLLPVMRKLGFSRKEEDTKPLRRGGILCGIVLFLATVCQQQGMETARAGEAGFITALYLVLVPLIRILFGRHVKGRLWIGVILGMSGTYLLAGQEAFSFASGDLWLLLCALFFSVHILLVDHYSGQTESLALCRAQFLVSGILAAAFAFILEKPTIGQLTDSMLPNLYAAFFSGCIAYSLQIVAQKKVEPVRASLLMCLESVFSLLSGVMILGERFTPRELLGCILLFGASLLCTFFSGDPGEKNSLSAEQVQSGTGWKV